MGKRKQTLMTGLSREQRAKAAIKRKEEQRKEKAREVARVPTPMVGIPEKWKSPEDFKRLIIEVNGPEIGREQLDALRKKFNVG